MLLGFALEVSVSASPLRAAQPVGKVIHKIETVVAHSQPSFLLANDHVRLSVTEIGGHMAPVRFFADPTILASTVFWMENHGRHGHPWNGRNNCLGLEDVTSHFADGLAPSLAENVLSKQGVPTTVELKGNEPTVVNYIQGVARIPADFDRVATIEFGTGELTLVSPDGKRITVPVNHQFTKTGKMN